MKNENSALNTFSGHPACQNPTEFTNFLEYVECQEITSYLEVGTGRGDTFHAVMSRLPVGSRGIAVDLPQAQWGLKESESYLDKAAADLREKGYHIDVVYGDSKLAQVYLHVSSLIEEHGVFDLVFIDGDHSYNGVKTDTSLYSGFAKRVALHDIANSMKPNKKREKIEVPLFWEELKGKYTSIEFIEPGSDMGIGIIVR